MTQHNIILQMKILLRKNILLNQFEMGKEDGFKEWRDALKNVLKKTAQVSI